MDNVAAFTEQDWDEPLTPEQEASIDAAYALARDYVPGPAALAVQHHPGLNVIVVQLDNGRRLALPVEDLQGIADATPEQLAEVEILGPGTGIAFDRVDAVFNVESLLKGIYGNRRWMAELDARKPQAA